MSFEELPRGKQTIVDSEEDQLKIEDDGSIKIKITDGDHNLDIDANSNIGVVINDADGNVSDINKVQKDDSTAAILTMVHEHHEIHEGDHYFLSSYIELNNAGVLNFTIQTPNTTKWAHLVWFASSTANAIFQVYEAIAESGGSSVTPINNNRNSANTSGLTIKTGATVSDTGTLIAAASIGVNGTNKFSPISGEVQRNFEIVLKQNTKYLIRVTSGADNNIINYHAEWYEHSDVE